MYKSINDVKVETNKNEISLKLRMLAQENKFSEAIKDNQQIFANIAEFKESVKLLNEHFLGHKEYIGGLINDRFEAFSDIHEKQQNQLSNFKLDLSKLKELA